MCLILFAYQPNTTTPLLLGANRDEYFARPTLAANYWEDHPTVLAGRDEVAGGTWIGITKTGRFAALTNIREPNSREANTKEPNLGADSLKSRGDLTRLFLTGTQSCEDYLTSIIDEQHPHQNKNYKSNLNNSLNRYAGFNLLVGEFSRGQQSLFYLNNREEGFKTLKAGIYGLSNHLLNTPWPKVLNGKQALEKTLINNTESMLSTDHKAISSTAQIELREALENPALAEDKDLPATGLSYEKEKALSASFIKTPLYGTRASTVIIIKNEQIEFSEKNYSPDTYEKPVYKKSVFTKAAHDKENLEEQHEENSYKNFMMSLR